MAQTSLGRITREFNKIARAYLNESVSVDIDLLEVKGQFSAVGSFFAYRIEDPEARITMKQASKLRRLLVEKATQLDIPTARFIGFEWIELDEGKGGVVYNWERV